MPDKRRFLLFAGIPAILILANSVVEAESQNSKVIEEAIDDLIDTIGGRQFKCIWAIFDLNIYTIATACEEFGRLMAHHPTAIKPNLVKKNA